MVSAGRGWRLEEAYQKKSSFAAAQSATGETIRDRLGERWLDVRSKCHAVVLEKPLECKSAS